MKYLFILPITLFALTAFGETKASPDTENCHYRTEDSHIVSNKYTRLLAQLSDTSDDRKKKRRKRQKPAGTGQR